MHTEKIAIPSGPSSSFRSTVRTLHCRGFGRHAMCVSRSSRLRCRAREACRQPPAVMSRGSPRPSVARERLAGVSRSAHVRQFTAAPADVYTRGSPIATTFGGRARETCRRHPTFACGRCGGSKHARTCRQDSVVSGWAMDLYLFASVTPQLITLPLGPS